MKGALAILIFIAFLMTVAVALSIFMMTYSPPQIVGGLCHYDEFQGVCNVTSVSDADVKFKFAPDSVMDLRNVSWVSSAQNVLDREYSTPVTSIGLRCGAGERCVFGAGAILRCKISIIKSGACTPVIFKFS